MSHRAAYTPPASPAVGGGGVLARFGRDMAAAWRYGAVRQGLLGTILLVLGSLTPAYLPQSSPYWGPARALGLDSTWAKVVGTAMVLAAVALLMVAWFRLRPLVYVRVKHWAVLLWWSLPLLPAPPIFSHDAYSYAAQGWLIHNGFNPYESAPGFLPGAFADQVAWVWRYTTAPYGPLALQISHGIVLLAGLNPYYSAVLMRVPAVIGVALIVYFLPRIAHELRINPRDVAWFSIINPLVVIDYVGGAHNDALMMGLVVWGIYLAYRGRFLYALIVVGVAMAVKQPALLAAFPVAIVRSGWSSWEPKRVAKFVGRALFAFAVVIGVFSLISVLSGLGFGWIRAVSVPGSIMTMAPFSLLGFGLQALVNLAGVDPTGRAVIGGSQTVGVALSFLLIGYLAIKKARTEPMTFLSWSYLAFAFFGPALHPWYLTWGGLLLPLTKPSPRVWKVAAGVTSVLLVYGAGNLAWRNDAVALAFAALAAAGIVIDRRRHPRRELDKELES
ncbi:polyprenol phosphomannose-dependent alpha 1,6 mannosyltransferase MptB [Nigerium massiliense]|uniref:polyprenol phosphomannose-dependent alpha 1,6 mannosyltransferase MptB n=1 Tax=Nigerium massiliense TaxID=1522317 RepID=UPI0006941DEC|nr:polyprenol phosphomannose-dependent alpha 1,6 mannosyltransferase MptB [Nigerium massiliense]